MPNRRQFLVASAAGALAPLAFSQRLLAMTANPVVTVYKDPNCGCCAKWIKHLQSNGFVAMVHDSTDMDSIKSNMRVPKDLQSCHTAVVDRYVIEGHVPASDIKKLLSTKEALQGLAAPGMPMGSPGMEGGKADKYDVIAFSADGKTRVFAKH
ncbi:MAG TPA: DUF411 domain-containing protein [Gemmatimonadaceae bacterium]|jgi:hypothetical protein